MISKLLVCIALLVCLPLQAEGLADIGAPQVAFSPMTGADGGKTWRIVVLPRGLREADLSNLISVEMGKAQWCPNGWTETSRRTVMKRFMIEGRCL